jgi:hypothetical protein
VKRASHCRNPTKQNPGSRLLRDVLQGRVLLALVARRARPSEEKAVLKLKRSNPRPQPQPGGQSRQ